MSEVALSELTELTELRERWRERWPQAQALWSDYVRLAEPLWCLSAVEAQRERLTQSFAMIRLRDHAVVLNMQEITERGFGDFAVEIMAHEIGHHMHCPGDLTDQARLLARVRRGLPGFEDQAPMIANLYADLLINDRLQRNHDVRLDKIYARLGDGGAAGSVLWRLYLRIYEHLWRLPRGTLVQQPLTDAQEGDARLGARLIRVYARDWIKGAASFAALCCGYMSEQEGRALRGAAGRLLDSESGATDGESGNESEGALPEGLSTLDDDELGPVLHPSQDPAITGKGSAESGAEAEPKSEGSAGKKTLARHRSVQEYRALMKQLNPNASEASIAAHYYRERARPYLIRYPQRATPAVADPMPEGLEIWDIGRDISEVDWVESVTHSPHVVPGLTTLSRVYGDTPGDQARPQPLDLYVGIDCSGSMPNPRASLSYPVLAGFIVALSAARAGARVMACLSGDPGNAVATEGFTRDAASVTRLLTDYLGSGYSYGIFRLDEMVEKLAKPPRPTHVLILTDTDIFSSLAEDNGSKKLPRLGWQAAEAGLQAAGGGGTFLLHATADHLKAFADDVARIKAQGWRVVNVSDWAQVLEFARRFAIEMWKPA